MIGSEGVGSGVAAGAFWVVARVVVDAERGF
jgi:hypothetical protein